MPAAIPCIGYPSRSAAVKALREQGKNYDAIARATSLTKSQVAALLSAAEMPRGRRAYLPKAVSTALEPHARRRGIAVAALARLLLTTIVNDQMVDSVLDDLLEPERNAA